MGQSRIHRRFCNRLKDRRNTLSLTQKQVAKRLGMGQSAYSLLEAGNYVPSIDGAHRAARALGTTAAKLLA